ncbi:T9SS type A sorting domain-containing protein [Winogradskyella psychrotolerans]|uniref:T9SS type A sorting domain-containing protein n=1 Tax=Winogradskyella psychrotolerans TaxID=1344585 RepID=UPI001C06D4E4|nr:T9SS type A sorting domain-containing protein [Winogradskyella psychrotolerans]MBU2922187.1 T9SS type A sorting domain-containing protein [Winogradskyella psychrotolerans]
MKIKLLLLTVFAFICVTSICSAQIYVDNSASGSNNGSSWTNAYTDIETALINSIIGDQIWVKSGIYKPSTSNGFNIPSGVKLYGSFDGTESNVNERDIAANLTTLNGDIGTVGIDTDNTNHVVYMSNVNTQTRLDGFRIINGYANNVSNGSKGGGLYNLNGSPTIANCTFISNYSKDFGGAIVSESGNIKIEDCSINNNTSVDIGGGIYLSQSGTAIILRTKIYNNTCTLGSGGGISTGNGVTSLIMDRCEISGNTAQDFGGAATIGDDTDFNLYNSVILGNISASNTVYMHTTFNTGNHNIVNCTFSGNKVENSSAASTTIRFSTNSNIYNSIFWDNNSVAEIYRVGAGVSDPTVDYCNVEGGFATGSNNINQDPLFVSPGSSLFAPFSLNDGYDYNTNSSSTSINAGNNSNLLSSFNLDYNGNARVIDTTVDLGAFEADTELSLEDTFLTETGLVYYNKIEKKISLDNLINFEGINKVSLYDISGKSVLIQNTNKNEIQVNQFKSGIYFITVENAVNKRFHTQKIIVF